MKFRSGFIVLLALTFGFSFLFSAGPSLAATGDPVLINETLISHTGTDDTEFIELYGIPETSLEGLSLIAVEASGATQGEFEFRFDFTAGYQLGTNGFFLLGNPDGLGSHYGVTPNVELTVGSLENSGQTMALVETSSLSGDAVSGGEVVRDCVAFTEGDAGDLYYFGAPVIGPDGSWFPAGGRRLADGVDTDTAADWTIADFSLGTANTPTAGDIPIPPPPVDAVPIYDIQYTEDPSGDSPYAGQTVATEGVVTADFGNNIFIQDGSGPWTGIMLYQPSENLDRGDWVTLEGPVSEFNGLTQFYRPDVLSITHGAALPAPEVLSSGDVSQEQWESVLVRVEQALVEDPDLGYGEWLVNDGSGALRIDDWGSYDYEPAAGDPLAFVQGPLHYSYGNFKLQPRDDADIALALTIMDIQGDGQFSAYEDLYVETTGVVTLFTANGANFWLQDPAGDGDPLTSDGIFVSGGGYPDEGPRPDVGDEISIVAQVDEQQYYPALPLTRLRNVSLIEVVSSGNALPDPVMLTDLPNESIPDGIAFWEPLEGMRVALNKGVVVGPTSAYGEFAMLTRADRTAQSGYQARTSQIYVRNLGGDVVDYNPERILVDDSSLDEAIIVTPGDLVKSFVGVVDYTFGNYKMQPDTYNIHSPNRQVPNTLPRPRVGTVIASFNVENLFDLVDNPLKDDQGSTPTAAELEIHLTKLTMTLVDELNLPEILVVQEVENTEILQLLGDRVNSAAGTSYEAVSFETSDGRGIEVGFLWDTARVDLLDAYQLSGPAVEAAFGPTSPSPGREPLVGVFQVDGHTLTIIGNHFKSKGGDDALFGINQPPIRATELQRKMQAQVVRDFVNTILDADPAALVMVAGDLNDFQFAEPGEGSDHPLAILEGGAGEVGMTNLILFEHPASAFTYIYDGNSQVLDHMLVSPSLLLHFRGGEVPHLNARYPAVLSEDPTTVRRASDHDPLVAWFVLR